MVVLTNQAFAFTGGRLPTREILRELGIELTGEGEGRAQSRLELGHRYLQQDGYAHAGVIATLADHTVGATGWTAVATQQTVLTVEFNVHFLPPACVTELHCEAVVLRAGRSLTPLNRW